MQKIRAQNIEIWPNGRHFRDFLDFHNNSENFSKIWFLGRFQNFFEFLFWFWLVGYILTPVKTEFEKSIRMVHFRTADDWKYPGIIRVKDELSLVELGWLACWINWNKTQQDPLAELELGQDYAKHNLNIKKNFELISAVTPDSLG